MSHNGYPIVAEPARAREAGAHHPLGDRGVQVLLGVVFCSGFSVARCSPVLSAITTGGDHSWLAAGAVGAAYYACAAAGAIWAGGRRLRVPRTLATGLAAAGALGAVLPIVRGMVGLAVVHAGFGLAVGVYSSVAQAALLSRTGHRSRALVTGVQTLAFAAGLAAHPLASARLAERSPLAALLAGGVLVLAGLAVLVWMRPECRGGEAPARTATERAWFPLTTAFVVGFIEAALVFEGTLPARVISLSGSAILLGSAASTLPLSVAADRLGRGRVLLACAGGGLVVVAALSTLDRPGPHVGLSFAVGASLGPLIALALAFARDLLAEEDLAWGTAGFIAMFFLGCLAGPVISSFAVASLGAAGVLAPTLTLLALLVVQGLASGVASNAIDVTTATRRDAP